MVSYYYQPISPAYAHMTPNDYPSPSSSLEYALGNDSYPMEQRHSRSSHSSRGSYGSSPSAQLQYSPSPIDSPQDDLAQYFNAAALRDIAVDFAEPVSSHRAAKSKRSSRPDSTVPAQHPCLHPKCSYTTARAYDLKRHMKNHFESESFPCSFHWCGRGKEGKPFTRSDHLHEHLRKVHGKDIPKREKGGRRVEVTGQAARERSG